MRKWEHTLRYADENLLSNREFALRAVQKSGFALKYFNTTFGNDKEIVLTAIQNSTKLEMNVITNYWEKYINSNLIQDKDIINAISLKTI